MREKNQKLKLLQNSTTKNVTKLKKNLSYSNTEKHEMGQNLTESLNISKNSNWQNSKPKIVTKLNDWNFDNTQKLRFLSKNNFWLRSFVKDSFTPQQPMG